MLKNNKGFTIIELIIIISIIGILVLLSTPKFLFYIDKASISHIKNDTRVAENLMDKILIETNEIPNDWNNISLIKLNKLSFENNLFNKKGLVYSLDNNKYKIIPKNYLKNKINTKLNGTFITDNDGYVYYTKITEEKLNIDNNEGIYEDNIDNNFDIENNEKLQILGYNLPNGIYTIEDSINGNIKVKANEDAQYLLDVDLEHVKSGKIISYESNFTIKKDEIKDITYNYQPKNEDRVGFYNVNLTITEIPNTKLTLYNTEDNNINLNEKNLICNYKSDKTVYLANEEWEYFYRDDFTEINKEVMGKIGKLSSETIDYNYIYDETTGLDYHSINVNVLANSNISGQIKTLLPMTYGSYEIRMKIPDSDSLLNGFFLYGDIKNSEIANEIDIEIMKKDNKWQIWTTIYNPIKPDYKYNPNWDPGVVYHNEIDLDFDPTLDYHNYRINYYENYISFCIDNIEFDRWNDKFAYSNMNLYAGTFYTFWLNNQLSDKNLQMNIEWIRRTYKY